MSTQARANYIRKRLQELFPNPHKPLDHNEPYTLLIAVLLSAQCTDERVNRTTPALFELASTPWDMAKLSVSQIQEIIRPCGLSERKAKAIQNLSHLLNRDYDGRVPDRMEALESLPGVGHKTASVVLVQAFGTPAFPVDTHIHRLAKHWTLSEARNVRQTEEDLKRLFPIESWKDIHLQIIFYGRNYFNARQKDPMECLLYREILEKGL